MGAVYAGLGANALAELGTMMPESGGFTVFVRRAMGPYAGFVIVGDGEGHGVAPVVWSRHQVVTGLVKAARWVVAQSPKVRQAHRMLQ